MCISKNVNYSCWVHKHFEHVQKRRTGLPRLHAPEERCSNRLSLSLSLLEWPGMTRNDHSNQLELSIHPRSWVDSGQWDWGINSHPMLLAEQFPLELPLWLTFLWGSLGVITMPPFLMRFPWSCYYASLSVEFPLELSLCLPFCWGSLGVATMPHFLLSFPWSCHYASLSVEIPLEMPLCFTFYLVSLGVATMPHFLLRFPWSCRYASLSVEFPLELPLCLTFYWGSLGVASMPTFYATVHTDMCLYIRYIIFHSYIYLPHNISNISFHLYLSSYNCKSFSAGS